MARDVSVGAPADEFNANGQDWGLTPFIPGKLRAAHYRPFIETIRAMLRHAGGLRIDHVMGLFRLFWIPRALRREGRRLRAHARRRDAGDRRAGEPARAGLHRRRGPGNGRAGRARAAARAAHAVVPAALLRAVAAARLSRDGAVQRDDARPADDRGAVDGRGSRGAHGGSARPPTKRGRRASARSCAPSAI